MIKNDNTKQFFPALTGYRAIAAWMIFVYHFMPFKNPALPKLIKLVTWEFHIGVDMFFVLSGFLITYRYYNDYPIHLKKYLVNRVARIYPMYFLITIAVFAVWFLQNQTWNSYKTYEVITSITMIKALFKDFFFAGIPQGWTLTLEEMFYFTAPFYFILIRKWKSWLFILPLVIFGVFAVLKWMTGAPENTYGFLQTHIHAYIIEFFTGIGLAYLMLKKKVSANTKWTTWFGLAVITLYLFTRHYVAINFDLKSDIGRFSEMTLLSIFGIAPLLWGLIHEKTIVQKILSTKWLVLLGKSSYIFYLIHKGFIPNYIYEYISESRVVIFVLLNIISILMFKYLEEPANLWIRRKFGKSKA
ncbi:MAG: acyltransferase [Bergeyella sp.]